MATHCWEALTAVTHLRVIGSGTAIKCPPSRPHSPAPSLAGWEGWALQRSACLSLSDTAAAPATMPSHLLYTGSYGIWGEKRSFKWLGWHISRNGAQAARRSKARHRVTGVFQKQRCWLKGAGSSSDSRRNEDDTSRPLLLYYIYFQVKCALDASVN